jgi:O-antigen/teichoic acid export membrane protein
MAEKQYSPIQTLKNTSLYFVTNFLQKALSFFLLPLYTVFLTPGDYGLVSLLSTFFGVVALLITLALNGAISRYYFIYKSDEKKQKEFIGTILVGIFINCLFWFVLIFGIKDVVINIFLKDIDFFPYIFLALITTVASPVYSIYQTILQIKQDAKGYSINSLLYFAVAISLNLLLIVVFKLGVTGLLLANAIPSVLFSIMAAYTLIKKGHVVLVFKGKYMLEALRFSVPLIPHILSGSIADYISKSYLYLKSNLTNVGLNNIAFQFGTILDIIQSAISSALSPYMYDTLDNQRDKERELIKTTTLFFKVVCFFSLGITLISKEIVYLMTSGDNFNAAWNAIPIIALGALFYSLYTIYGTLLFYNVKGTRFIWIASFSGNFVNILFTYWFTEQYTYLTPAIAGVVYKAIMFIIVYYISRKIEPVKYELGKMLMIILLFIVFSAIGLAPDIMMSDQHLSLNLFMWKVFVFIMASILLLYEDRKNLKTILVRFTTRSPKVA